MGKKSTQTKIDFVPIKIGSSKRKAKNILSYLNKYIAAFEENMQKGNQVETIILEELKVLRDKTKERYKKIKDPYLPFYKKLGAQLQSFLTQLANPDAKFKDLEDDMKVEAKKMMKEISDNIGDELMKISRFAAEEVKERS